MAKVIRYQIVMAEIDRGTEENPDIEKSLFDKEILCPNEAAFQANLPIAQREAYNGEYTIEDDGVEETAEPTAQEDTDAMLIDHEYRLTMLELDIAE